MLRIAQKFGLPLLWLPKLAFPAVGDLLYGSGGHLSYGQGGHLLYCKPGCLNCNNADLPEAYQVYFPGGRAPGFGDTAPGNYQLNRIGTGCQWRFDYTVGVYPFWFLLTLSEYGVGFEWYGPGCVVKWVGATPTNCHLNNCDVGDILPFFSCFPVWGDKRVYVTEL